MPDSSTTVIRPSSPELPPGYELLNFTIERKLGRGGFGIKVSKNKGNFIGTLAAIFVYVLAAFVCWICFYC